MSPKLCSMPLTIYTRITHQLNILSNYIPPLFLRLILAVEFGAYGIEKLHGTNWFRMFLPLIFGGAGKLSLDYLIKHKNCLLKSCSHTV